MSIGLGFSGGGGTEEARIATVNIIPTQRTPAPTSIPLPSHITALWWKLDEGTGITVTDEIQGKVADVLGTTTNLWDVPNYATFNTDTVIRLRNDATLDALMRLDNLNGSLIIGYEIIGGNPSSSVAPCGYGNHSSNTYGAVTHTIQTAGLPQIMYSVLGGAVNQTHGFNNVALMKTKNRNFYHIVIHNLDGRLYYDGYESGWHSRSSRLFALEAGLPTVSTAEGLRIGGRPSGAGGGAANLIGAAITLPSMANWHAIRIVGDYRHMIPGWIDNITATMPYNAIPEVLNG